MMPAISPFRLRQLALSEDHRPDFVAACKASIAAGEPIAGIMDAIKGTRWRFLLTKSGQAIEVEHKDDLYAGYWQAVSCMKECRSIVGKDEYEHIVLDAVRDCLEAHRRVELFITDDDNIGQVDRAILDLFNGTGYRYTGGGIEYDEDWIADEE